MSSIQVVPEQYVYHVWDKVDKYLAKGLQRSGGEYTADQLKVYLTQGINTLIMILNDEGEIKGALTIQWKNFPNDRVAFITAIGGATYPEAWEMFLDWLRQNGCTAIRGAAFESVARLWKQKYGFESRYVMVEKRL
jgi:hypothetical protein